MATNNFSLFRISSPRLNDTVITAGVNNCCHGLTTGVTSTGRRVMHHPRVVLIFWGNYYRTNPDAVSIGTQFITDLITGPFMNGLAQYGVGRGSVAITMVIDTDPNAPAPATLDQPGVISQLKKWISGLTTPAPALNEENLLYFIFPPTTTKLTLGKLTDESDFCGYHSWDKVNDKSIHPDLFFGIVSTRGARAANPTEKGFVGDLSGCISHELSESFTDRDGGGYFSSPCTNFDATMHPTTQQSCEIGDLCEDGDFTYQRKGSDLSWKVQQYWSNWDRKCINGDQPVSLRSFLNSIKFDFSLGLTTLGPSTINIEFIASRE